MAYYDSKPSAFEEVGNGSLRYRFDITEETVEAAADNEEGEDQEPRTQWKCNEVFVWPPFTSNRVLEAAIAEIIPASRETKLINDYNAAKLGLVGGSTSSDEAKANVAAYKEYLNERAALKAQIEADCAEYGLK